MLEAQAALLSKLPYDVKSNMKMSADDHEREMQRQGRMRSTPAVIPGGNAVKIAGDLADEVSPTPG